VAMATLGNQHRESIVAILTLGDKSSPTMGGSERGQNANNPKQQSKVWGFTPQVSRKK